MAKVRNVSGGDLYVPALNHRTVADGEVVDVPDGLLKGFLCQPAAWADESPAVPADAPVVTSEES